MQRALKAAGMNLDHPQRGLHLLRHSLATRMLTKGVALKTIADVLGHDSMETTRRYAQVDLAGLRSVALSEAEVSR
jgi:site-specific recombinase XerD